MEEMPRLMGMDEPIGKVASEVTGLIKKAMPDDTKLYAAALHLISAGGKRLRPFIVVKFFEMFEDDHEGILPVAASVELIHNFTLVHDDIMDRDDFRHGVPTVHRAYGEPFAILAGDTLFAKAFQILSLSAILRHHPDRYMKIADLLAGQSIDICEGQAMDITKISDFYDRDHYMELIKKKTSALFIAASEAGVLAAGKYEHIGAAKRYGESLGSAFQIVDDLLGIVGNPKDTGKPVGDDIREGKKTLPIFIAFSMAGESLKKDILSAYEGKTGQRQIERLVEQIRGLGIEERVKEIASAYAEEARGALSSFPKCQSRDELGELVELVIKRSH